MSSTDKITRDAAIAWLREAKRYFENRPMKEDSAFWANIHNAECADKIAVLIEATPPAPAPDGWVMVPREPTEAMHDAARDWSAKKYGKPIGLDASDGCYRAMIAAAPAAPTES